MKTSLWRVLSVFIVFASCLCAGSRDAQWQQVDAALKKELPKTAIEHLDGIVTAALADHAYPEAMKALLEKITLEGTIQGGGAEEKIARLQTAAEQLPAEMKPVVETVLAHWYWQYFQQNRWKISQRTHVAGDSGGDLKTWDLARLLAEIDRHFSAALTGEAVLKKTPISAYDELLTKGIAPDAYRPTVYDFLVYQALQFYQAGEQGSVAAEEAFEIAADSPIFGDTASFLNWKPETNDETAPHLKALRLYQALLRFHKGDADRSAFFDADLARLSFGHNVAVGETKDDRYQAALERFAKQTTAHEISARAMAELASLQVQRGHAAEAHRLAEEGAKTFPQSVGAALCRNIAREIESPSAQLNTESVWNAPWPAIEVRYKNIGHLFFRVVPLDFDDVLKRDLDEEDIEKAIQATPPALAWKADLSATTDYEQHEQAVTAPTGLKPGYYCLAASGDESFGRKNNFLAHALVWVSDLALVMEKGYGREKVSGFVLAAGSGEPKVGAKVRFFAEKRNRFETVLEAETDQDGRFEVENEHNGQMIVIAESDGQRVTNSQPIWFSGPQVESEDELRMALFTDRAIYRPGQTISYKGVVMRADEAKGDYGVVKERSVTVVLKDVNGLEVARTEHLTNDYGSFAGTFTAPRDRALGAMSITAYGGGEETTFVRVEEYKRPKFQVELAAPKDAARLEAAVTLTGKATAYTGAAVGGAKVQWRVMRQARLPWWCWWWRMEPEKAIAHGSAITEADGTFKVAFTAAADRSVAEKDEPIFEFSVHADVTDTTGETRSADRNLRLGYAALQASLSAEEWQTTDRAVSLTAGTSSLDGVPQACRGSVTVYALQQPATVQRASLEPVYWNWRRGRVEKPKRDLADPNTWELGAVIAKKEFATGADGQAKLEVPLPAGIYRAVLETHDSAGKAITARCAIEVVAPEASQYGIKQPNQVAAPSWTVQPGETFRVLWGTGYDSGRAWVEILCNGQVLKRTWTSPGRTQALVELPVTEAMRGGFNLRTVFVHENRCYSTDRVVEVPWKNKELTIKWETFRSKLMPGEKETWTAALTGPDAKRAAAEMAAVLYDASLDAFAAHDWRGALAVFRNENAVGSYVLADTAVQWRLIDSWRHPEEEAVSWSYRSWPATVALEEFDELLRFTTNTEVGGLRGNFAGSRVEFRKMKSLAAAPAVALPEADVSAGGLQGRIDGVVADASSAEIGQSVTITGGAGGKMVTPPPDLNKVTARKNLNETAFFFPQLLAGDDGVVRLTFTMPEALTEWKFLAIAHDKQLRSGYLTDKVTTSKDLMVEPNPPRFLREGDVVEFSVKVSNQSDVPQAGQVRLTFSDAATLKPLDAALGNAAAEQTFEIPAKQARSFAWRITVPDGLGVVAYKTVAATSKLSDGEEGAVPVLSRRILVTESLPLPVRGAGTKTFTFEKLLRSGASNTLRSQSLTVQMVSQPAWYAVMALPYLMEYPYECSEQVFSRYYANALAAHIAGSDPKIRRVFDLWKYTPALDSPLEKNQELKSVLIEETPWVREAQAESQARRNVGLLFDENRLASESARALRTLAERQGGDGLWSWFPGGRSSEYISLYIVTGFGRLRHLGVEVDPAPALKALQGLDAWMDREYRQILKGAHPEQYVPGYLEAQYLYGRSFFLADQPVTSAYREAVDFFVKQAGRYWTQLDCRQCQAQFALALQRFGHADQAQAIVKSLKERSVSDPELGMYWRDHETGWWWYQAPIETQAMMIEAFDEVAHDAQAVEDCKVWLLKQKQTQDWKTTKATADAVYGLLLRGTNLLASDALVDVSLGGTPIVPANVEAGTGFYEQKFVRDEIQPAMGNIVVKKTDDGVSWGSVHWQYLEDMAKITPHEGTPLTLKKTLFVKETTAKGPVLKPVTGPVAVGDELVVRIELRTDRDMEFVHLKDQRGSGTEPVNVLSQYKWQDGLGYYETTRDTASHFFIDYLRKGTYVFEYSVRVQLKGRYQTGMAEIQCMYAPEFNSHSESFLLDVK